MVFGYDYGSDGQNADDTRKVYSVILIGNAKIPESIDGGFIEELGSVELHMYCGQSLSDDSANTSSTSVNFYEPLWQSDLTIPEKKGINNQPFKGTVIIARTPTSGAIHTIYTPQVYNLRDECGENSFQASNDFQNDLSEYTKADNPELIPSDERFNYQDVGICVTSENASRYREVRIARDGHNTSAISTLSTDIGDDWLNNTEGNQCNAD